MYINYNFVCIQKINLKRNSKESDILLQRSEQILNYKKYLVKRYSNIHETHSREVWDVLNMNFNPFVYENFHQ